MRGRYGPGLVALLLGALTACTSLSGLSGGGGDAGGDGSISATGGDGSISDAGGPVGADAPQSPGFCASLDGSNVVFCDDFDQPGRMTLGMEGWGTVGVAIREGTIEDTQALSSPNAAIFSFGADGGALAADQKTFAFPEAQASFGVQLALRPSIAMTQGRAFGVEFVGLKCSVSVDVTGTATASCPANTPGPRTSALAQDQWTATSLKIARNGNGIVTLTLETGQGGTAVTDSRDLTVLMGDAGPVGLGDLNMKLTLGESSPSVGGALYVDNVVVTEHP